MGDIAVLSAFKTGFLFPLTYFLVSISLPSTLVYPFLFYFLSLLSFYFLSKEFLKNESLRVLVSLLYLINPVTPYYFASLINAFSLVLLPLGIKFFVRTLKEIEQSTKPAIFKNFILTALFLGLCVSANEQFVFSVLLITLFILVTFAVFLHKKYKILVLSFKAFLFNMASFGLVFVFVNIPLFVSIANIQKAPWATYFQGHSTSRFLATVEYTYRNVDLNTLLRLGGDSGTGLGQSSWYDSFLLTNLFGYVLLILFILSILILAFKKDVFPKIRLFFYQIVILFIFTLILLLFMKNLPNSTNVFGTPIDLFLETWESPSKLRVILLVSLLTVTFVIFSKLEFFARKRKNKLIVGVAVTLVLLSTFIYNSPWLINYGGKTTLQEVTDVTKGGDLYNERYVNATRLLDDQGSNGRGIIIPYTHETELYASPNSRIFQIVSQINQQTSELVSEKNVQWSKTLGLFSIKTVAVMNYFNLGEGLIFPDAADIDVNSALTEIRNDSGFKTISQNNDFTLMDNQNALPLLYASSHYVFFDSIGSLKYAFNFVDFKDLPVFLQSGNSNGISIPSFVNEGNYKLYALSLAQEQSSSNLTLSINNLNDTREVMLNNTNDFQNLPVYSTMSTLFSGDMVKVSTPSINQTQSLEDVTLNSTSTNIGTFGSFTLDFNVNILENG
ncbi:MAG: hypothetical protein IMZ63_00875, partial [Actinobacteria bacterium]|nr:hypothetical protein [Actinomycetota bacterium]